MCFLCPCHGKEVAKQQNLFYVIHSVFFSTWFVCQSYSRSDAASDSLVLSKSVSLADPPTRSTLSELLLLRYYV
jgi:hypothetical protein